MSECQNPKSIEVGQSGGLDSSLLELRAITPARVALDRTGISVRIRHALEFSVAHAQARDAVHASLAVPSLLASLRERHLGAIAVKSQAGSREEYLRRPDLGRTLAAASRALLVDAARIPRQAPNTATHTVCFIVADGLSALAAERHALPLLDHLRAKLKEEWAWLPIVIAEQARVALADEIGSIFDASITVMLIGERPGLSSPDSLGAYITWLPQPGRKDSERNCVSNIRLDGLQYENAAARIGWYLAEAQRIGLTGIGLRDDRALPDCARDNLPKLN